MNLQSDNLNINGADCEDEDEEVIPMSTADRNKPPLSLEKLIALVVSLVEKSRNIGGQLELSDNDLYVLQGMKVILLFYNAYNLFAL